MTEDRGKPQTDPGNDTDALGEGAWSLVTQLPPAKPDTAAEITAVREISGEELDQARAANALLVRLSSVAPYARLVELYQHLPDALARKSSPQRTSQDLNHAARALASAAEALPSDLRKHATDDLDENERAALERAIEEECQRPAFRLMAAVGRLSSEPFAATEAGVTNNPNAIDELVSEIPEATGDINLVGTLGTGVVIAQRLIGRQLKIYEERISAASLLIRRLAAEVPDGGPALMRAIPGTDGPGKMSVTFEPMALDEALHLHRALRVTSLLLDATEEADVARNPNGAPMVADTPIRPTDGTEPRDSPVVAGQSEGDIGGELGDELPDPDVAMTSPPAGGREDQVIDLRALARHALELTDELEQAWSSALDSAALDAAQGELSARLGSLLNTIQRRVAAADRELQAAGLETQIPAFPLPPDQVSLLTLNPDPERRWRQLQMAEIESLMLALPAIQAIREPSAHRFSIADGETESWWEAGAFALARLRLSQLVRTSDASEAAEAAMLGKAIDSEPARGFFDRLRLAGEALGRGDPEGSLLHALVALRLRAAIEVTQVPDDLIDRLGRHERLQDTAPLLGLLRDAARSLGEGEALDLGAAVLIAPRALELVGRICVEEPHLLLDVLQSDPPASVD